MDTTTPAVESQPQEVRIGGQTYKVEGHQTLAKEYHGGWALVTHIRADTVVRRVAELEKENAELRRAASAVVNGRFGTVLDCAGGSQKEFAKVRHLRALLAAHEGATSER